ncbi:BAHD acyltransferase DCR-like [Gastrolobium bilobum]|uniref:BAHD acyltransferase DCR-like n=1 Tax=Gastrolobium bilobum TaxID=150636 RepID=UPI002AB11291|nr:BAHD acyltransferase DCR-like [Gastrolobium bilobum]
MAAGAMKNEECLNLKITGISHVKPNKKIGKKEYQLVTFDLPYLCFYYNQKLLFYKGDDFEGMVKKLKDGLSVVLEDFHQLAGKLGKDEEGVFRVEYDDDMAGVEVTEAVSDEIEVADLIVSESNNVLKEMVPYNGILNFEGMHRPLLAVQLTKIKDGLVIGCAFNHGVLDGTSTWHFMTSWAETCRGAPSTSTPPFLERTKARNTCVKYDLPPLSGPTTSSNDDAKPKPGPPLREKIFRFSDSAIEKIKSTVNETAPSDGSKPFSTFQALSVHIWRYVSHARNLKPEDHTVFTVFADCRKRVDPPMPETYFGNLIQAIFTVTAVGLLWAQPPQFGASMIQKAIEGHNAKVIDEFNKRLESAPKIFEFKDAGVNSVAVGSSPRFKVYDVDFGWGKPENVRSGSNNKFDGMIYLYPGKNGGKSIDVELTLESEAMGKLEQNKEFLMEI